MKLSATQITLLLIAASLLLFLPFLGSVHLFDWDEINFAECAREMLVTGNGSIVQIDFKPFWEKPPLFIWMQAISMLIFGVGEFAARFPNAICGIITAISLFAAGKSLRDKKLGILWATFYLGSILPHVYFKSGIIDPWFNYFIMMGILQAIFYTIPRYQKKSRHAFLAGLFIGLAVLTKGPVALIIFGGTYGIFLLLNKFKGMLRVKDILIFLSVFAIVGGSWFFYLILSGHSDTVKDFIDYQLRLMQTEDAGHGQPFYYHFAVLLVGCFPASAFAIYGHRRFKAFNHRLQHTQLWMVILFWLVLIMFSIVKTKIVHYSSMCYFPLTFLAAYGAYHIIEVRKKLPKWLVALELITGITLAVAVVVFIYIGQHKELIDFNHAKDLYTKFSFMQEVPFSNWQYIPAALLVSGLVVWSLMLHYNNFKGLFILLTVTAVFTNLTILMLAPKVEAHTQGKMIAFYESVKEKDDLVVPFGFKSYAHYFYTGMTPKESVERPETGVMLDGDVSKPVYFILKRNHEADFRSAHTNFSMYRDCGGYVVYKRND